MGIEKPPQQVKDAINANDRAALSAMGKKGAEIAQKNRELKADKEEVRAILAAERKEVEELARQIEANEHILTPDGEDSDYTK